MKQKYVVRLNADERSALQLVVRKGNVAAYKRLNAQMLLKADEGYGGPGWKDSKIADAFDVTTKTVARLRERLCTRGFDHCLERAKGAGRKRKLDGHQEAHLIALTCSEPPEGRARWTLRLLADQMVELEYVDELSHETVRQLLKKRNQTLAEEGMVHSPQVQRRFCLSYGRGAGGLSETLRSRPAGCLYG